MPVVPREATSNRAWASRRTKELHLRPAGFFCCSKRASIDFVNGLLNIIIGSRSYTKERRELRNKRKRMSKKRTGINKSWHRPDVVGLLGSNQVVQLYAADIVDERWGWEGPAKDLNHQFWNDLGRFAKAAGLEWGGDWKKPRKDVAHVQMAVVDLPPARSAEV